jgi:hypothetical protein
MHARVITVTIAPDQADAARSALHGQVVPMVKAEPGFVTGYWSEGSNGKGLAFVVFESEEQARQAAPPAGASPAPGVTVDSTEIFEVVAQA